MELGFFVEILAKGKSAWSVEPFGRRLEYFTRRITNGVYEAASEWLYGPGERQPDEHRAAVRSAREASPRLPTLAAAVAVGDTVILTPSDSQWQQDYCANP